MCKQVTVVVAFDNAVAREKDVNDIVRLRASDKPCANRGSNSGNGRVLIQEQLDVIRWEAAAAGAAKKSRQLFGIAMREAKLAFGRHVLVTRYPDDDRP